MSEYRKDDEVRAVLRKQLIDNLIAMGACIAIGVLLGLFIGLSLRFH
jgi:hypothetical protein